MTILDIRSVSKSFVAPVKVVDDVSLSLADGEILCLLGPSGCGKTTLLRIVAGLETADSGAIWFEDHDMSRVPPHERGMGLMFQDFALFPHLNVYDNVAYGLRMQKWPAASVDERVREMLELVQLSDFAARPVDELSGGEQQRVALARSLAPGPSLLMLDEPLGALDRSLRERLMLDLRQILKEVGVTALYVTHEQTEAFAVGDRIAIMNAGRIEQIGPPQAVYKNPATPFVARFLGYRNLVQGVMAGGQVNTHIGRFDGAGGESAPLPEQAVTLLIPPDARVKPDTGSDCGAASNEFRATVTAVSFRGRFSQVWLECEGEQLMFEVAGDLSYGRGDRVCVTVEPHQLRYY